LLDNNRFEGCRTGWSAFPGRLAHPVILIGNKNNLLTRRPVIELVRPSAHHACAQRGFTKFFRRPSIERSPVGAISIPAAISRNPCLALNRTPTSSSQCAQEGRPRLGKVEGNCAGGFIRYNAALQVFAHRLKHCCIICAKRFSIVIRGSI